MAILQRFQHALSSARHARGRGPSRAGRAPRPAPRAWRLLPLVAAMWTPAPLSALPAAYEKLTIVAPGSPDGGWGQTAQTMERVLREAGLVREVDLVYYPGGGGTVALAQFLHSFHGNPDALFVGGSALIGSVQASGATVSLLQATPIARLTRETLVVLVPAGSRFTSLAALCRSFRDDPSSISWAAGHHGGAEHQLLARISEAMGVAATAVRHVPSPGGGASLKALLGGQAVAGIAGHDQVVRDVRSRRLRALGIASPARLAGSELPTLKEQGLDLAASKWRAVFAAPGIGDDAASRLGSVIEAMVAHQSWRSALEEHRWTGLYLDGVAFARFLEAEHAPVSPAGVHVRAAVITPGAWLHPTGLLLLAALASGAAARMARGRGRTGAPPLDVTAGREPDTPPAATSASLPFDNLRDEVERQFDECGLTAAEREIAWLMLNGLRHKEIAELRNTSERTVRHQALAVYRKTGLDGRTNLAAHFLGQARTPRR